MKKEKKEKESWTAPEHGRTLSSMTRGRDRSLIIDERPECMRNPKQKEWQRLDAVRTAYNAKLGLDGLRP